VPCKRPKKRVSTARPRPRAPCGPHQVWSYDFVSDHCANGQQLKCLTVTDEFTKEGLAIDVGGRIRSARVIEVPSRLVIHRHPDVPAQRQWAEEFVSKALLSWIVAHGIGTALIEPGKPWQNGFPDSGRPIRPSQHIEMSACFPSSSHRGRTHAGQTGGARDKILPVLRSRGRYVVALYNHVRPHSSLDYLTRTEFVARGARSAPRQATDLDAAVHGTSAPQPIAEPSRRGQMQPAREAVSS